MAKARKRYRVILAYGAHRVGDIIEPNGLYADSLMGKLGGLTYIELLPVEPAVDLPQERIRRKRGRPRKHPLPEPESADV